MYKCEQCGKEFDNGRAYGGHKAGAHNKYGHLKRSKIITLERVIVTKQCENCDNDFEVERLVNKDGTQRIGKREKRFCSRSCANIRTFTEEQNKSKGRKGKQGFIGKLNPNWKGGIKYNCSNCGTEIGTTKSGLCRLCLNGDISEKNKYHNKCQFKFNLATYPNEFNFTLIEEHGWYKAKNHGDNPNGVSRDHIVSVKYGFDNNIDLIII